MLTNHNDTLMTNFFVVVVLFTERLCIQCGQIPIMNEMIGDGAMRNADVYYFKLT